MEREIRFAPLASLVEPKRGISYGIVQPGQQVDSGVPIVRVTDVRNGRIDQAEPLRVAPEIAAKYRRTELQGGELLLTIVGTVGETAVVPKELRGWNTARAIAVVPVLSDPGPRWVQYALQTGAAREYINTRLNTTVQATLNLGDVSTLPIPMPPRAVRERVLDILGALDDKIELNRRMSETLESMARELFKSWFVDFDPARAKAEGRAPIGVDAETAKLFPSEFVDSDLGPIPQGWKRSTLSEACQWSRASINPADQPNEQFEHFSIPAFDSGRRPSQDFGSAIKSLKFKVPRESVLVSKLNPAISRVWLPSPRTNRAVCSTEFLVGVTNPPIRQSWLYLFFLSARVREAMIEQASGTSNSHQRVRPVDLDRLAVVVPPAPILSHFDLLVSPLLERVNSSQLDSDLLASIRSALLPRLISGDLSVEGVERALEATA